MLTMAMLEPAVWGKGELGGLGGAGGGVLVTRPPGNSMTKVAESMLTSKISIQKWCLVVYQLHFFFIYGGTNCFL